MKFKLLTVLLLSLLSINVLADEPVKDTPLNAYVAGGLKTTGEIIQDAAHLMNVPVNPVAKKSVETIQDNFKDNDKVFIVGKYTAPIVPILAGKPVVSLTVELVKRPPAILHVTKITADTVEEVVDLGKQHIVDKMASQGLTHSKGVTP